jgi:tetratricopeptide (TPR) repeat protein
MREPVARALVNKGVRLGTLNRSEEEIAAYDEVVRRFGEAGELAMREPVARALVNKGNTLEALSRKEEAIASYDEVLRRVDESDEPDLKQLADDARERRTKLLTGPGNAEANPSDSPTPESA